jgi:RNA polymerase sigma factor (sigma-70 family)
VAGEPLGDVLRLIGRDAGLQEYLAQTDAQLLDHFTRRRDEPAFAALMVRHGPMVYGVCRRMLGDAQEAEDAYQASFLVLARKAGAIRKRSLLGAWLYGVACRIAARLRGAAARRRERLQPGVDIDALPADAPAWSDVGPVVHEEVQRLPSHYRDAVVLCFLEGKSNEEAAEMLRRPVGTIKSRLTRARELLRSRLARRGLGVASAVALTTALVANMAQASAGVMAATTQAAARFAGGAAGPASERALALARAALRTVLWKKAAILTSAVVVVGALITGGVWMAGRPFEPAPSPPAGPAGDGRQAGKPAPDDKDAIQGDWRVVRVEYFGRDVTNNDDFKGMKEHDWRFTTDQVVVVGLVGDKPSKYTLDPTKQPKQLDLAHDLAGGPTIKAIYSLKGDELRIHLPSAQHPQRPTDFTTRADVISLLLTFERDA